jgi:glycosyltransferase involved in cell wall biosynthesis
MDGAATAFAARDSRWQPPMNGISSGADSSRVPPEPLPLVSVLVGAFNHERYIGECLDSIVAGSYPNVELVVFDDASVDNTKRLIRDWIDLHPDTPVRFLDHLTNRGLTFSLNEAVDHARGSYLCIIAGDDVMLENGIKDRVDYLEHHPDKLAVFADSQVIDDDGNLLFESAIEGLYRGHGMRKDLLQVDALMPYNIVFHWAIPGPVFMCRNTTFAVVGPYDEQAIAEDVDMYLRLAARGQLGFCDAYVAQYRRHRGGMTSALRTEVVHDYRAAASRKNMALFGPICRLRLATVYWYGFKVRKAHTRPGRIATTAIHKVLLAISWRAYWLKRGLILRSRHHVIAVHQQESG